VTSLADSAVWRAKAQRTLGKVRVGVSMLTAFSSRGGRAIGSVALFRRVECLAFERPLAPPSGTAFASAPDLLFQTVDAPFLPPSTANA